MKKVIFILIILSFAYYLIPKTSKNSDLIKIGAIKNPKPNMVENEYIELEKIAEIGGDIGDGYYLFHPFSITSDNYKNIYIYDNYQAKIFKFNKYLKFMKSFGRKGNGPGEFSGTGMAHPVYIEIVCNKYLFGYDTRLKRAVVFNLDGDFLNIQKSKFDIKEKISGNNEGRLYNFFINKNDLYYSINGLEKKILSKFTDYFKFIYRKPKIYKYGYLDLFMLGTRIERYSDNEFNIFLYHSSKFLKIKNNKVVINMNIFPKNALRLYMKEIKELFKNDDFGYRNIFINVITNKDSSEELILQYGKDKSVNRNLIYSVNLKTKNIKVLMVESKKDIFNSFELKLNGIYYSICENKINLFKEVKNESR